MFVVENKIAVIHVVVSKYYDVENVDINASQTCLS